MSEHFPKIVTEMISDIESSKPNGNGMIISNTFQFCSSFR